MLKEFRHHGQLLVTTSALQIKSFKSAEKILGHTSNAGLHSRPEASARRACLGKARPPQRRPGFPSDILEVTSQQIPDHLVSNVGGHP